MNNPPFRPIASQPAEAPAWERRFGHPSVRNWGTADTPAPTSALVPGSGVVGVAHLVGDGEIDHVIGREASNPVEIEIVITGERSRALTWPMTDAWATWSPERLAQAAWANVEAGGGPFGNAHHYLTNVVAALTVHARSDALADRYLAAYLRLHGVEDP